MASFVKEFENYILSDKREESLISIIPGSEADLYLQLAKALSEYSEKKKEPENFENLLRKIKELNSSAYNEIKFKKLLKGFDIAEEEKDEQTKEKIIKELKSIVCPHANFNYTRPTNSKINLSDNSENSRFPSALDQNCIPSPEKILEKFYEDQKNNFHMLNNIQNLDLFKNLNWEKVDLENFFRNWLINQQLYLPLLDDESGLISKIAQFLDREAEKNKYFPYIQEFVNYLPIELLEKLSDALTSSYCDRNLFLNLIINKTHAEELAEAKLPQDKKNILLKIYEKIKAFPPKYQALKASVLLEILNLNVSLNKYEVALFLEYIASPVYANKHIFKLSEQKYSELSSQSRYNISGIASTNSDSKVIADHLDFFFLHENHELKTFEDYLDSKLLKKHFYQSLVLKGEESEEAIRHLGQDEFERLIAKTEISICKHNKQRFEVEDDVVLELDVKNVQTLFVKIFEINTENYYYTQKTVFDTSLSLEGLVACSDETFIFNEKPQVKKRKEFNLSGIPKKRGLFIVEFIGGGFSSRAIIKKGSLNMISRETPLGKSVYILNEKGEVCKPVNNSINNNQIKNENTGNQSNGTETHNHTGIWFKGSFYAAKATGLIVIPFAKSTENDKCILSHDGFSELSNFSLSCESYALQGVFHVNHESLTMGNTAKVIFKPYLTLNGREAALSKLKNSTLTALVSKQVNGEPIPTSQVFDKITLDKNQEFSFELQIPPKLSEINLNFEAEVFNNSKQENQQLYYNYSFKNYEIEDNFIKMFLRNADSQYSLYVLGKNGEPKSDCVLSVQLNSRFLREDANQYCSDSGKEIKLQTDQDGKVLLGELKGVKRISAALTHSEGTVLAQKWDLPDSRRFLYPERLDVLEHEKIVFPISCEDKKGVFLIKIAENDLVMRNLTKEKLKFVPVNDKGTRFNLEINDLEKGQYRLGFVSSELSISISVHEGKYWDSDDFIITPDAIIESNKSAQKVLSVSDIVVNQEQDEVLLKIYNADKSTRIHIYAYQFLNPSKHSFSDALALLYKGDFYSKNSQQVLSKWSNIFLDNRKLNDEIQYVFDRKNLERQMGNSLEKPSLLLKRKFIRDTVTEKEVLEAGTAYERKAIDLAPQPQMLLEKSMCFADLNDQMQYNCNNGSDRIYRTAPQANYCSIPNAPENYPNAILSYNNFLSEPASVLINLPAEALESQDGQLVIKNLNLNAYSHLQIFVVSESSCYQEFFSLAENPIKKRDLTLKESLDTHKAYAELRIAESFAAKTEVKIDDITSTSFKIIDSIEKVAYFKVLLNKNLQDKWNEFKFLLSFDELTEEEQKHKITKYFSHELNVFLYFKHPQLFSKLVLPILKFKAEKTFIDFFLMNDLTNILRFAAPNKIHTLSVFEKCLLVFALKGENAAFAAELANLVESEAVDSKNEALLKRHFDILMNMKNEGDQEAVQDLFVGNNNSNNNNNINLSENYSAMSYGAAAPKMAMMRSMNRSAMPMNESVNMAKMSKKKIKANWSIEESEEDEDSGHGDLFGANQSQNEELRNQAIRKNFDIAAGTSKEYCETHFLEGYLIEKLRTSPNQYWADLAVFWASSENINNPSNCFLSKNILLNSLNISDLLFTLAVLDLPFRTLPHKFTREGEMGLKISAASNLILFTKTIKESNTDLDNNLMIAQSVYLNNINIPAVDNKNVTEFVTNKIYCHKTNMINLTPKSVNFDMLIQIPEGAVPVRNSDYTRTVNQNLNGNVCEFLTFFYFPNEGEFLQYPPTASKEGVIISKGISLGYSVKQKQQIASSESLDDVLESGSKEDILRFFTKKKKIIKNDLQKIYWIMTEKSFFSQITQMLRSKGIYDETIWLMGFLHSDPECVREYIENRKEFRLMVGNGWNSRLLRVDDSNDFDVFNHLDYHPLLNARVHKVGQANKLGILNREFRNTYQAFIVSLIGKSIISDKDYLRLSYYLILQDRIEEASRVFNRINSFEVSKFSSLEIQYDYVNAYLDFSLGYPDFTVSRALCKKYKEFPLEHWRELFEELEDQLIQFDGTTVNDDIDSIIDEERKKKVNVKNAFLKEPKLTFAIENRNINITYQNIDYFIIKFYLIDLEVLFSRNPFFKQNSNDFTYVLPNFSKKICLEKSTKEQVFCYEIPAEFRSSNIMVEVSSLSLKAFDTYFSTSLKISISESLGEVKVTDKEGKNLNKVYVKCFAQLKNGTVNFYKDGYTDLRGKFNFITLNTDSLGEIQKFALFVMDDVFGSAIKECSPPPNLSSNAGVNNYDNYMNYRQEVKTQWRSINKKK